MFLKIVKNLFRKNAHLYAKLFPRENKFNFDKEQNLDKILRDKELEALNELFEKIEKDKHL